MRATSCARFPRLTPAALAFLAVLAPAQASQALLSKPLPLQLQKPQIEMKVKQPIYLTPKITTVTPQTCVRAGNAVTPGDEVTLVGSNFGFPKPAFYTLAVQPAGSFTRSPFSERSWSSTSITFNVPAGLAMGSTFTAGILSGEVFVASTQLSVCPKIQPKKALAFRETAIKVIPESFATGKSPSFKGPGAGIQQINSGSGIQPSDPVGSPEITSVSPPDCVIVGKTATANGVNLGTTRLAAGFSLGYQANNELPTREILESTWSPTSVSFKVPPEAGLGGWFALGIIFDSIFYPQQYVSICGASSGQSGSYGGGYYGGSNDSGDYGNQDPGGGYVAIPKGARRLGPGGVDVQIVPSPAPDATAQEQPPQPGKRAVGGKLLAMKALASKGLHKVNKECDLYDPHCPCCRKDDSVCLEKESDNDDGTSIWVVFWKEGVKTVDGQGVYDAKNAENDVEAVTGLQCESVAGGDETRTGGAKLNCR